MARHIYGVARTKKATNQNTFMTKKSTCVAIALSLGLSAAANAAIAILVIDGSSPEEIQINTSAANVADTQIAGSLRNMYFDDSNDGQISGATELRGSGNDAATFNYTVNSGTIATGNSVIWQWVVAPDPNLTGMIGGTVQGFLNDFTLNVNGSNFTVSGLATNNPLTNVGGASGFNISLTVIDTGIDSVTNIAYGAGGGNDAAVRMTLTAVPEPSAAALLGLGGLALVLRRRK